MTVGAELTLGLYLLQQLGVMLGVGSAAIMLVAYVVANRDGTVDEGEAKFARTLERVLMVGLFLIISSGIGITVLHMLAGETSTIFTPAYILKWFLIVVVALPLIVGHQNPYPAIDFEGFVGAHWFMLFVLHIVAPIASWLDLIIAYVLFVVVFLVLWGMIARALRARVEAPVAKPVSKPIAPEPKLVVAAAPAPKPPASKVVVLTPTPKSAPVLASTPPKPIAAAAPQKPPKVAAGPAPHKPEALPAPHAALAAPAPTKPALSVPAKPPEKPPIKPEPTSDLDVNPFLPGIRVMPRTPEDVDKQLRASVVQFS